MKAKSRIVSLLTAALSAVLALVLGVATLHIQPKTVSAAETYVETDFGAGELLITTTQNGTKYYMSATEKNSKGAPLAKSFTDVSTISKDHLWTVTANGTNWQFQTSTGDYLYSTADNNGLRFGTGSGTNKDWTYGDDHSFKNVSTSRFLGVYNGTDWRSYTTVNATNYKESSTSFTFYTVNATEPSVSIEGNSHTDLNTEITLEAKLANIEGTVAWSSSNTNVATIVDGVVTPVAMGTTTITADVNGTQGTKEIKVYPVENSTLTIAEALTVCELTGNANSPYSYSTVGTISECSYNDTYSNYEVTITDGTNSIIAYAMTCDDKLNVDNKITVTGYLINYKGTTPEFAMGCSGALVLDDTQKPIQEKLDSVNAHMQLAYKYTATTETVPVSATVMDTLDRTTTGVTGTSYTEWSGKKVTSDAVYAGYSAGGNSSIQLNNNTKGYGIITTTSGGKAKKIVVEWNSNTVAGRTLNVYGKNEAYTATTDLYSSEEATQGTLIGTIVKGTSTELTITGDYEYIGFTSAKSAMYLDSVKITWATGDEGGTKEVTTYSDSEFRFMCGVDASLAEIADLEGVAEWGISVTANGKTAYYNSENAGSWSTDEVNGITYVVVSLGDIINDMDKLGTEFTVKAYAVCDDGTVLTSSNEKTYSVKNIVKDYYDEGKTTVENLYNYLWEVA